MRVSDATFGLWAIFLLFAAAATRAQDSDEKPWAEWRGPRRDGSVVATDWPEGLNGGHLARKWRSDLASGYSGAIVDQNRVFVLETVDKSTEQGIAFDRWSGREIWRTEWKGGASVRMAARRHGDWIKSTPAFDGERLYAAGTGELLVCINAADGTILWKFDFPKTYGTAVPGFGCVSSPIVVGNHVYMQAANSFVKIDKKTGKAAWRTLVSDKRHILLDDGAEASPVYAVVQKQPQLIVQARCGIHGVDPESGQVLWSQTTDAFMNNDVLTPVIVDNNIFTSCQKGGVSLFYVRRNQDAFVCQTSWHHGKPSAYMSSPVVSGGFGFLHLENKRFACVELKTGRTIYTSEPFGEYWSMAINRDKILALDGRGELLLIRANPTEFELIDRRQISDHETWGHVAIDRNQIFVREKDGLLALDWK